MFARMTRAVVSLSVVIVAIFGLAAGAGAQKSDGLWPRVINNPTAKIVVYQPQIESFDDVHLAARAAVSVTKPREDPVFGAVWFDARTSVDKEARVVTLLETKVTEAKFPDATPGQTAWLKGIIEAEIPNWGSTMSYDDLVAGLDKLLKSDHHLPVNIGNPYEMTVLEFAKKIIEMTKSKSEIVYKPLPEDDPQVRQPDITKARMILGWEPKVKLEEGLVKTIEYFRTKL